MKPNCAIWLLFTVLGFVSCQRFILTNVQPRQTRRVQLTRLNPQTIRILNSLGLGGLLQNSGYISRPVAVQAPQVRTITLNQAGTLGGGGLIQSQPPQPIFVQAAAPQQVQNPVDITSRFDTSDTPESSQDLTRDRPEIAVAPRGMVNNAREAAIWQKLTESDGVIVV